MSGWSSPKRDVREYEYKYLLEVFKMLETMYGEHFLLMPYQHPMLGDRHNILIKSSGENIDLCRVLSVEINFENNFVKIQSDIGTVSFNDIIKDETMVKI